MADLDLLAIEGWVRRGFRPINPKQLTASGTETITATTVEPATVYRQTYGGTAPQLLTASDFTYLGSFSVGNTPAGLNYGYGLGAMAMRYYNGELRQFIMTPSGSPQFQLVELRVPDTLGTNFNSPVKATFVKNWGRQMPNGTPTGTGGNIELGGLFWDSTLNGVWYQYGDAYNNAGYHDPCLGFIRLNDTTGIATGYGPWRTQQNSQYVRTWMFQVPNDFAVAEVNGYPFALGATMASGNAGSPWGIAYVAAERIADWATREPDQVQTSPAQTINPPDGAHPRYSVRTQKVLGNDISHRHPRAANYISCGRQTYGTCVGAYETAGAATWSQGDKTQCGIWIDLPEKYGIVYLANVVWPNSTNPVPHEWYDMDSTCCAGQHDPYQEATGPGNGGHQHFFWIYDPAEAVLGARGTINPWDMTLRESVSLYSLTGLSRWEWARNGSSFGMNMWFDDSTRRLYLSECKADWATNVYEPRAMTHVFQVSS